MADLHFFFFFLFLLIFILLCNPHTVTSTCTLDFDRFPYEVPGECFDTVNIRSMYSCCHNSLQHIFQAMAIRSNISRSIFLDYTQAQECSTTFQGLHNKTKLSECRFQNFITSSSTHQCSTDVDFLMNLVGMEKFNDLRSSCGSLTRGNRSEDVCYNCVVSYRRSLEALSNGNRGEGSERVCAEALLVSLASSDVQSENFVEEIFSCLWNEINFPWSPQKREKGFHLSKKFLAVIIVVVAFVLLAPVLYKLTRKRLRESSNKEIESLSVTVLKKALEDESINKFSSSCFNTSSLHIFSQVEIFHGTNSFSKSNLIGEGSLGKTYVGVTPSGRKVAIKRINAGMKLHSFVVDVTRMSKIRHPNLLRVLGFCDDEDQCLVYEYCAYGDLAKWLMDGEPRISILTWDQRIQIVIGIGQALWFLHNNPLEKLVHGDVKLTNILLNERLEAKLSDFIISNNISKQKNGVQCTVENDIYGFGVVLLQLLTGKKNIDVICPTARSLLNEARYIVKKGANFSTLVDPRLSGAYDAIAFRRIMIVAVLCTNPIEHERPNMEEILQKIQGTQDLS